jgi:hypothetical protein
MNKPFNNDTANNDQRAAYLDAMNAMVENHGDDDDPKWVLFYKGTRGQELSLTLDAQTWEDSVFEACNIVKEPK